MSTQKKEELILWNEIKKGNVIALGQVYDLYIKLLFSYGFQLSNDKNYVMDCIHDLFLDLYKYRERLSATDNIKYYLITSLRRKINRKYKHSLVHFSERENIENQMDALQHVLSPEERLIALENDSKKVGIWQKANNFLTKTQLRGLQLRFMEERPYEEIAEIMDVSVGTSRTIIYRAIKSLRKNMILPTILFGKTILTLFLT
ncbi:sigma-70 family RNA polymerase sigma factor [uncultured Allomuricauda sp.]|uniref:RNA polymerase sigma factor n=1 Tax=Flagellimonas sp. W118 TaxID=3410791 RepID=UPI00262E5E8E|nr:sigma-70 family RNA polymerase sigma factor [uncultured Allomuricauda sp.]